MSSNLEYLKYHHPYRVFNNSEFKFKFIIGEYDLEKVKKENPDRIVYRNVTNQMEHKYFHYLVNKFSKLNNCKILFLTNDIYLLKFMYKGEFVLIEDGIEYDFDQFESYDNYLAIYEEGLHK